MSERQEMIEVVNDMFDEVLEVIRDAQLANLTFAWKLGSILDKALNSYDDTYGKGIARELVKRLNENNCDVKISSLYAYRTIFLTYKEDEIPELIKRGLTQTHAQTLAALPTEVRAKVEEQMEKPDGSMVSTRELKKMVDEMKKDQARLESETVAARSAHARDTGDSLTLVPRTQKVPTDAELDGVGESGRSEGDPADGEAAIGIVPTQMIDPTAGRGNPELTKAMAARGSKEFTHPPIKTLKTADSTLIKMLAQASQLVITLDEANRIGFDSDRSQKNFLDAAQSLEASLSSYAKLLPELSERLRLAVSGNILNN